MEKVILSLLFPTALSVPNAMFLIIAYVVGAILASALAIRTFRFVKQHRSPMIALPKPVSGATASRSTFSLGRATVWSWPIWTRLWVHKPLAIASAPAEGKAATVATFKKLAIELLPTTGLPPYPKAIPTPPPIAQLVDLGLPHTPPPSETTRSGHPFLYNDSSRPSSPSPNRSSSPILRPQSVIYPSGRRSPSPQALLVTSPPRNHKRTRSLGGVVVRRASGGYSGLRNQVDLEMQELLPSHTRGFSGDQLLIDFSPSKDAIRLTSSNSTMSSESTQPFVDIGDDPFGDDYRPSSERVDEQWKWFGASSPTKVRSYDSHSNLHRLSAWPVTPSLAPSITKLVAPVPIPLPSPNPSYLVDTALEDSFSRKFSSFDSGRTLVEPWEDNKIPLVDPFGDDFAVDLNVVTQESAMLLPEASEAPDLKEITPPHSPQPHRQPSNSTLLTPSSQPVLAPESPNGVQDEDEDSDLILNVDEDLSLPPSTPPHGECLPQQNPHTSVSKLEDDKLNDASTSLENCDVDDIETVDMLEAVAMEYEVQEIIQHQEVVEKSPGGSLLPTALNDQVSDEEVPELNLESGCATESEDVMYEEEAEDDATPKATPTSENIDLLPEVETMPASIELPLDVVDAQSAEYPDPDLLPLPEFILNKEYYQEREAIPLPRLQMPTPPASPPSMSPIRLSLISNSTSVSPQTTKALTPVEVKPNSTIIARPAVTVSPPLSMFTCSDDKDDGATPIAVIANKPVWTSLPSEKADAPAVFCEDKDSDTDEELTTDEDAFEENSSESSEDVAAKESLPGSFPDSDTSSSSNVQEKSVTTTIGARLASSSVPSFRPSARDIIRQPLEIALAMQLRPGLGAGADPAWMVRFLMAMFGWLAVVVSGQPEY
ncbi:hypothetical protein CPB83DRAFT_905159 [Crepidotus variabilis]|uniref:Uncharacterized protein n=1 Tax=Crepidotus variabilis TaxID=179855 RepID=A0A9P6JR90_9AGAR|nr:hypothetical protein CPB83DRAFT_905159 [Crepidotus variabilis]